MANRVRYVSSGPGKFISTKRHANPDGVSYGVTLLYVQKGAGQFVIDSTAPDELPFVGQADSFKALVRRAKRALEARGVVFTKETRKKKAAVL